MTIVLANNLQDDVRPLTDADYDRILSAYVQGMSALDGVHFIGQFGSVGAPGISDLDVLVVVSDDEFRRARLHSEALIATIPDGEYVFWHPPAVLPSSLLQDAFVVHTFEELRRIWGELSAPADPPSAPRVTTIAWNSFVWGSTLRMGSYRSARRLLLVLGNIAQSVAATNELLGDSGAATNAINRNREVRDRSFAAGSSEIAKLLSEAFAEATDDLKRADWGLQSLLVPAGSHAATEGSRLELRDASVEFHGADPRPGRNPGKPGMRITCHLPSMYLHVAAGLEPAFGRPYISARVTPRQATASVVDDLGQDFIQELQQYANAVAKIRAASHALLDDEYALFGSPFIVPFALRLDQVSK